MSVIHRLTFAFLRMQTSAVLKHYLNVIHKIAEARIRQSSIPESRSCFHVKYCDVSPSSRIQICEKTTDDPPTPPPPNNG